tara:strand:- start:128 stop:559 length:432 start_codon:yes stop_codon:yes gene_type:complete
MNLFENEEYNNISNTLSNLNEETCLICRDTLDFDIIKLKCDHKYHTDCLKNTFCKYQKKVCPYCDDYIQLDSYKSKCIAVLSNGNKCDKICHNIESTCKRHLNIKNKNKEKNSKKIETIQSKINQYKIKIKELQNQLNKLKDT